MASFFGQARPSEADASKSGLLQVVLLSASILVLPLLAESLFQHFHLVLPPFPFLSEALIVTLSIGVSVFALAPRPIGGREQPPGPRGKAWRPRAVPTPPAGGKAPLAG
eukprot:CAMPEP_0171189010 /NCGR_PEP_ID=MMETSP0790-20130122/18126_1 /TAXON_ID=2925 /ORGANISM="Alexandrium catenella, Strain OF101" /LENGTH=108 /DNA_ID=CAMNT_0011654109 /DNA_START=46 /DNA_END=369 /DNA_ORIENTATION=-